MMRFNIKSFFSLFLFVFIIIFTKTESLDDYGFKKFEEINDCLSATGKNRIFKKKVFRNFTEKVLNNFLTILSEDLYDSSRWFEKEVPFYINVKESVFNFFKNAKDEDIESELIDGYFQNLDNSFFISKTIINKVYDFNNFIIVGDLHGNYFDFIYIIRKLISEGILNDQLKLKKNYKILFLGDIVDRGNKSLELILFIFLLKILNKESVFVLKGNHESYSISVGYGFGKELFYKSIDINFFVRLYGKFLCLFDLLPEAYCFQIDGKNFFFSHGGWNGEFEFKKFLKDSEHNYFKSFSCSSIMPMSPFLWNDISPFVSKIKRVLGRGICYPSKDILSLMDEYKIEALFKGHDHCMPKQIEFGEEEGLKLENLEKPSCGFCELEKNRIFLIISTSIYYPEEDGIIYKPTYAHLKVDEEGDYNCSGVVCN
ncbi:hypothetical protein GF385_04270 [Candidatus Dependentiae bacterium]|nr:hypothetical protein [Candidatus Dependentiae bacterium]